MYPGSGVTDFLAGAPTIIDGLTSQEICHPLPGKQANDASMSFSPSFYYCVCSLSSQLVAEIGPTCAS
jgi:hypothetical protein